MRRIHRPHRRALDVEMSTISFMSARVSLCPLRFSVLPDFVPCAAVSRSTGPASRPWITERKLGRIVPGEPHLKITRGGGGAPQRPLVRLLFFQVYRCWRRRMLTPVAHSHVDRPAHGRAFAAVALRDIFKCFRLLLFSTLLPRTGYNKNVFLDMKAASCVLGGGWGIF